MKVTKKIDNEKTTERIKRILNLLEEAEDNGIEARSEEFEGFFQLNILSKLSFQDNGLTNINDYADNYDNYSHFIKITHHLEIQEKLLNNMFNIGFVGLQKLINSFDKEDLIGDQKLLDKLTLAFVYYITNYYFFKSEGPDIFRGYFEQTEEKHKYYENYVEEFLKDRFKSLDQFFDNISFLEHDYSYLTNFVFLNSEVEKILLENVKEKLSIIFEGKEELYLGLKTYLFGLYKIKSYKIEFDQLNTKELLILHSYLSLFKKREGKYQFGSNSLSKFGYSVSDFIKKNNIDLSYLDKILQDKILNTSSKEEVVELLSKTDYFKKCNNEYNAYEKYVENIDLFTTNEIIFHKKSGLFNRDFILRLLKRFSISLKELYPLFDEEDIDFINKSQNDQLFLGNIHPYIPSIKSVLNYFDYCSKNKEKNKELSKQCENHSAVYQTIINAATSHYDIVDKESTLFKVSSREEYLLKMFLDTIEYDYFSSDFNFGMHYDYNSELTDSENKDNYLNDSDFSHLRSENYFKNLL